MPRPNLAAELLPNKAWEPDSFTARHQLICDLHLAAFDNRVIAEKLDLSESRVSVVLSDPRAHAYIRRHREKMQAALADSIYGRLEALASPALDALEEDVRIENPTKWEAPIRQKAYFGVLGALGYGPVQKQISARAEAVPQELLDRTSSTLEEMRSIQGRFQYSAPEVADVEVLSLPRGEE
jgi:hypothetical protein